MPNLLLFAPCEKAIVDRNGALSLVSIIGKLTLNVPANAPQPPANSIMPMTWAIVSIWQLSSDWDFDRPFEQRGTLVSEAGVPLINSLAEFKFIKDTPNNLLSIVV